MYKLLEIWNTTLGKIIAVFVALALAFMGWNVAMILGAFGADEEEVIEQEAVSEDADLEVQAQESYEIVRDTPEVDKIEGGEGTGEATPSEAAETDTEETLASVQLPEGVTFYNAKGEEVSGTVETNPDKPLILYAAANDENKVIDEVTVEGENKDLVKEETVVPAAVENAAGETEVVPVVIPSSDLTAGETIEIEVETEKAPEASEPEQSNSEPQGTASEEPAEGQAEAGNEGEKTEGSEASDAQETEDEKADEKGENPDDTENADEAEKADAEKAEKEKPQKAEDVKVGQVENARLQGADFTAPAFHGETTVTRAAGWWDIFGIFGTTITIIVEAGENTVPEGTTVSAEEVNTADYAAEIEAVKGTVENSAAFDIKLMYNGVAIEPNGPVQVTIKGAGVEPGEDEAIEAAYIPTDLDNDSVSLEEYAAENGEVEGIVFDEPASEGDVEDEAADEADVYPLIAEQNAEGDVSLVTDHFSLYVISVQSTVVKVDWSIPLAKNEGKDKGGNNLKDKEGEYADLYVHNTQSTDYKGKRSGSENYDPNLVLYGANDNHSGTVNGNGNGNNNQTNSFFKVDTVWYSESEETLYYTLAQGNGKTHAITSQDQCETHLRFAGIEGYQVTYDLNGGALQGQDELESVVYENATDTVTITDATPARAGFMFLGWSLEPDAEEADYVAGDECEVSLLADYGEEAVLYADWESLNTTIAAEIGYYKDGEWTVLKSTELPMGKVADNAPVLANDEDLASEYGTYEFQKAQVNDNGEITLVDYISAATDENGKTVFFHSKASEVVGTAVGEGEVVRLVYKEPVVIYNIDYMVYIKGFGQDTYVLSQSAEFNESVVIGPASIQQGEDLSISIKQPAGYTYDGKGAYYLRSAGGMGGMTQVSEDENKNRVLTLSASDIKNNSTVKNGGNLVVNVLLKENACKLSYMGSNTYLVYGDQECQSDRNVTYQLGDISGATELNLYLYPYNNPARGPGYGDNAEKDLNVCSITVAGTLVTLDLAELGKENVLPDGSVAVLAEMTNDRAGTVEPDSEGKHWYGTYPAHKLTITNPNGIHNAMHVYANSKNVNKHEYWVVSLDGVEEPASKNFAISNSPSVTPTDLIKPGKTDYKTLNTNEWGTLFFSVKEAYDTGISGVSATMLVNRESTKTLDVESVPTGTPAYAAGYRYYVTFQCGADDYDNRISLSSAKKQYKINYDLDGGTGDSYDSVAAAYAGDTVSVGNRLDIPQKKNYIFKGWELVNANGARVAKFNHGDAFRIGNYLDYFTEVAGSDSLYELTLRAIWEVEGDNSEYTIQITAQLPDGTVVHTFTKPSYKVSHVVVNAEAVNSSVLSQATDLPANFEKNYQIGTDAVVSWEELVANNYKVVMTYTSRAFTVTYITDSNGTEEPTVFEGLHYGDATPTIEAPTKNGCAFSGWQGSINGNGTLFNGVQAKVTGDTVYTAQWGYQLVIHYVFEDGSQAFPDYVGSFPEGALYHVNETNKLLTGYKRGSGNGSAVTGTMTSKGAEVTLVFTPDKYPVTVTTTGGTFTYDGTEHGATVEVSTLPAGYTVEKAESSAKATHVSESVATATCDTLVIKDSKGKDVMSKLNVTYVDGAITINPAPLTVATKSASKSYDGTKLTAEGSVTGFVDGEGGTLTVSGSQTKVGESTNTYSLSYNDGTVAGDYQVVEELGKLTVSEHAGEITVTAVGGTFTYDGAEHKATVEVTGLPKGYTAEASSDAALTHVGNVEATCDSLVIENYDGEDVTANLNIKRVKGSIVISARPLTITTKSASRTYNGTALTAEGSIEGLVSGETVSFAATGSQLVAGFSENTYSLAWDGTAKQSDYTIASENKGTLTVSDSEDEIVVTTTGGTFSYDGLAHGATVTVGDLPAGYTLETATSSATATNVTSTNVTATCDTLVIKDVQGNDVTNELNIKYVNGFIAITPVALTVTTPSASKAYDGEALTAAEGATIAGMPADFVEGVDYTFQVTGTQTVVGSSTNTYSLTFTSQKSSWLGSIINAITGQQDPSNCTVVENLGTLTVSEFSGEVIVATTGYVGNYDGTEHAATVKVTGLPEVGYTLETATSSAVATDATAEAITATCDTLVIKNAADEDVTSKLNITKQDGTIKINPATLTVTTESAVKEYDGKPLTAGGTIEGFVNDETATFTVTGTQTEINTENPTTNTYSLVFDGTAKESNYTVVENLGTLQVTEVPERPIYVHLKVYQEDGSGYPATNQSLQINVGDQIVKMSYLGALGWGNLGVCYFPIEVPVTNSAASTFSGNKAIEKLDKIGFSGSGITAFKGSETTVSWLNTVGWDVIEWNLLKGVFGAQGYVSDDVPTWRLDGILYIDSLHLDANGGEGAMDAIDGVAGLTATVPSNTFTRRGYEFVGWNTEADGSGTSYTAGNDYVLKQGKAGNDTLYAQWKARDYKYTVNYLWNGTNTPIADVVEDKAAYNFEVVVEAPALEGYTLKGASSTATITIDNNTANNVVNFYYYKNVTLTGESDSKVYNGSAQELTGFTSDTEDAAFEGVSYSAKGTAVGEHEGAFSEGAVGAVDTAEKYVVATAVPGALNITEYAGEITVTTAGGTFTYDGQAHGATVAVSELPEGYTLASAASSATATHVADGAKTATCDTLVIKNAQGKDVTSELKITKVDGSIAIAPATLNVVTPTDSRVYNGKTLKAAGTIEGFVGEETATFTTTGAQTAVGSSNNTYSLVFDGTAAATDYTVSETVGTLTVTEHADDVVVTTTGGTFTYDGQAHGATVAVSELPEGYTLETATSSATATHVVEGTKTATCDTLVIRNAAGEDVTSKLKIVKNDSSITITPATLTVTTPDASKTYDGTALTAEGTVTGFIGEETATLHTTGTQTAVGTSDNSATMNWDGSAAKEDYVIQATLGKLTVSEYAGEITVTTTGGTFTYDGQAHGATVAVSELPAGYTLASAASSATATNVADGEVAATCDTLVVKNAAGEYVTSKLNVKYVDDTVVVTPATLVIVTQSATKEYDEQPLTAEGTITGLVNNETVTFAVTGSQTEVGTSDNTYTLEWGTAVESNYTVSENIGKLVVSEIPARPIYAYVHVVDENGNDVAVSNNAIVLNVNGQTLKLNTNGNAGSWSTIGKYTNPVEKPVIGKDYRGEALSRMLTKMGFAASGIEAYSANTAFVQWAQSTQWSGVEWINLKGIDTAAGYVTASGTPTWHLNCWIYTDALHLDANGGQGTMAAVTGVSGTNVTVPANTFTREGYTFAGWNTQADGKGTSYSANQDITLVKGKTDTLYAQWNVNTYDYVVNYLWNGTDTSVANSVARQTLYGSKVDATAAVIEGCTLVGSEHVKHLTVGADTAKNVINFYYYKDVALTGASGTLTYDGTQQSISGFAPSVDGLAFKDVSYTAKGTAVGEYSGSFSEGAVGAVDSTGKYIVAETKPGTLKIVDSAQKITVTTTGGEFTYDGKAHKAKVSVAGVPKGYAVEKAASDDAATHVAEGTVTANCDALVIKNAAGEDVTSKLNIEYIGDAIAITPAALTVTTESDSKVYDGEALTAAGSISGFVGEETATFAATGSQTEVGSSENAYSLTFDGTAVESDYTVSKTIGTLTVTEHADEVVVTTTGGTFTYDGQAHGATVAVTGLPKGYAVETATSSATATHVADGKVTATCNTLVIKNAQGKDVTSKLNIKYVDGTVAITPATLTVTTPSAEKTYNGEALDSKGSIAGLVGDETVTFATTGTQTAVGSGVNSYSLAFDGTAAESDYTVVEHLGTLTVNESTAAITVTTTGGTFTYDGQAHGATVAVSEMPAGYTLASAASSATATHVADGKVTATCDTLVIKNAQGEDVTSKLNITMVNGAIVIAKAALTVVTPSRGKVYDGEALTAEGSISGFIGEETATFTTTGSQTDAGESDNTFDIVFDKTAAESDYSVSATIGKLLVSESEEQIVVATTGGSKTYDGAPIKGAVIVTGVPKGYILTKAITHVSATHVTEEPIVVTIDELQIVNAKGEDVTAKLNIKRTEEGAVEVTPAELTVTTPDAQKTYDGSALTAAGEVSGFVNEETAVFETTGSQTEVGTSENTYAIDWEAQETTAVETDYTVNETIGTLSVAERPYSGGSYVPTKPEEGDKTDPEGTDKPEGTEGDGGNGGSSKPSGGNGSGSGSSGNGVIINDDGSVTITDTGNALNGIAQALARPFATISGSGNPMAGGENGKGDGGETTIGDDENALMTVEECFIHFYMVLGLILTALYGLGVMGRRRSYASSIEQAVDGIVNKKND